MSVYLRAAKSINTTMADIIFYHNEMCNKSKAALQFLQEWDIKHTVRLFIQEPFTAAELKALLKKLNMKGSDLIRKNTPLFLDQFDGVGKTEEEWLQVMVEQPALIERPIAEKDGKALIVRPPEKIFDLMD